MGPKYWADLSDADLRRKLIEGITLDPDPMSDDCPRPTYHVIKSRIEALGLGDLPDEDCFKQQAVPMIIQVCRGKLKHWSVGELDKYL